MGKYIVFTGNNTFCDVEAEDYNDAYSKVDGYLGSVSEQWKTLYGQYYKLHSELKKYNLDHVMEYTTINGEIINIEDILKLDYIYLTQEGDEFVLPIQYLNDEQMYILVAYMERIIKLL